MIPASLRLERVSGADCAERAGLGPRQASGRGGDHRGCCRLGARRRHGLRTSCRTSPSACPWWRRCSSTSSLPLDCHLMIDDPDRWAPPYAEAGRRQRDDPRRGRRRPGADAAGDQGGRRAGGLGDQPGHPGRAVRRPAARTGHAAADDRGARIRRPALPGPGAAEDPPGPGADPRPRRRDLAPGGRRGRARRPSAAAPRPGPTCSSPGSAVFRRRRPAPRCGALRSKDPQDTSRAAWRCGTRPERGCTGRRRGRELTRSGGKNRPVKLSRSGAGRSSFQVSDRIDSGRRHDMTEYLILIYERESGYAEGGGRRSGKKAGEGPRPVRRAGGARGAARSSANTRCSRRPPPPRSATTW